MNDIMDQNNEEQVPEPADLWDESLASPSRSQQQQNDQSNPLVRKIQRAASVALFNGCFTGICAFFSLTFGLASPFFGPLSVVSLVVGVGLAIVAYNEFHGRKLIRNIDLRGPSRLGWNQVGFLTLIVGYCVWCIVNYLLNQEQYVAEAKAIPQIQEMEDLDVITVRGLLSLIVYSLYGGVIALSIVFQGLNALFYFRRRKFLEQYLGEIES